MLVLALPPSLAGADEPAPPALSGRWTLDPARSEDARQKLREAGAMNDPRGGGGGRGPRDGGAGGRPRGGGGGGRGAGGFHDGLGGLMDAPPGLAITQSAAEIAIVEEEGRFRALHPDGKEYKGTGGEKVETRWEGSRLVVETKGERGPKLVETFEPSGNDLVIVARLEGGRGQPVSVRRVYVRSAAAE